MSFFKKFLNDSNEKNGRDKPDSKNKNKFLFPLIDDDFSDLSKRDTSKNSKDRIFRKRKVEKRSATAISKDDFEDNRKSFNYRNVSQNRKFQPVEVPPPMHLLNKPDEIVIELKDLSHIVASKAKNKDTEEDKKPNLGEKIVIDVNVNINDKLVGQNSDDSKVILDNGNTYLKVDCEISDNNNASDFIGDIVDEKKQYEPVREDEYVLQQDLMYSLNTAEALASDPIYSEDLRPEVSRFNQLVNEKLRAKKSGNSLEDDKFKLETLEYDSYQLPSLEFLQKKTKQDLDRPWLGQQIKILTDTFSQFNVNAKVVNCTQGPTVTRFEVQPDPGVKVSKITQLSDDLKLSLAAKDIRIEAPIPGKRTVGIEIPNRKVRAVVIREILEETAFQKSNSPLTVAMGLDISGQAIVTDLGKMPHGLVAGATGSGKSVFINSLLVSLLYRARPDEVKLLLIDPKMVELNVYNEIPHLIAPVIVDAKAATASLKWAVEEMERRYEAFAAAGVRDIARFNEKADESQTSEMKIPYIVIVIDELADLMMSSPADVEEAICRIAQKARAAGMHLIVATQRPSVDVITGLIKANVPTRIAFGVASQIDSRTILGQTGAEKLLGKGDMLFLENGTSKTVRVQGTFLSDLEIDKVVSFVKEQAKPDYLFTTKELLKSVSTQPSSGESEVDQFFLEACTFALEMGGVSTSSLQRRFRVGYNRAARLIDLMEQYGVISNANGSKPRKILIDETDLDTLKSLMELDGN